MQTRLKKKKAWISIKIEVIIIGPRNFTNIVPNQVLILDGITLASSNTVMNIGAIV